MSVRKFRRATLLVAALALVVVATAVAATWSTYYSGFVATGQVKSSCCVTLTYGNSMYQSSNPGRYVAVQLVNSGGGVINGTYVSGPDGVTWVQSAGVTGKAQCRVPPPYIGDYTATCQRAT